MNINNQNFNNPFLATPSDERNEIFSYLNLNNIAAVRKTCQLAQDLPPTLEMLERFLPKKRNTQSKRILDYYENNKGQFRYSQDLNRLFKKLVIQKQEGNETLRACIEKFKDPRRTLQNLYDAGIQPSGHHFRLAIEKGNIKILKTLLQQGYRPTSEDLDFAVKSRNRDIISLISHTGVRTTSSETLDLVINFLNDNWFFRICPKAKPTAKTLDLVLKKHDIFELDSILLGLTDYRFGDLLRKAMPSSQSIDLLLDKYKSQRNSLYRASIGKPFADKILGRILVKYIRVMSFLIKKGARPKLATIRESIKDKIDSRLIKLLIEAGGDLDIALSVRSDEKVIQDILFKLNGRPRSYDLNQAIFYGYRDKIIRLFLKKGASPDKLTLQLLDREHTSDENSSHQLSIRTVNIIQNHFYNTRNAHSLKWDYPQVISRTTISDEKIEIDQVIKAHQPREDIYVPEDLPFFDEVVDPLEDPLFKYCGHKRPRDYPETDPRPLKRMRFDEG